MAFQSHCFRVKHLNGTSGCRHYRGLEAERDSDTKCATNGCSGKGTRACHVIMANQNSDSGTRYIVYCCPTCNGQKQGEVNDIRKNAEHYPLDDCDCGFLD
jgi:hypothetical protein